MRMSPWTVRILETSPRSDDGGQRICELELPRGAAWLIHGEIMPEKEAKNMNQEMVGDGERGKERQREEKREGRGTERNNTIWT